MAHYELVHDEEYSGFDIRVYFTPELDNPQDHFDDAETIRKINDGLYLWFTAKVTASKNGVELAADYLGACCYESVRDFVQPGDYYDDMRDNVVRDAQRVIAGLCSNAE